MNPKKTPVVRRGCPGTPPRQPKNATKSPAIFLDRDGVINVDQGYVSKIKDFKLLPNIAEAVQAAKNQNIRVIVVTNQSGIGRGYYTEQDFLTLTDHMLDILPVDAVYYCPHDPDAQCPARKPGTRLIEAAQEDFELDLPNSLLIGDKPSDIKTAEKTGIPAIQYTDQDILQLVKNWLKTKPH